MASNILHEKYEQSHVKSSESVKDFVIGMADGLTVPFALVAGLSGVVNSIDTIVIAGFAEIIAGMIAMGLGGYLAAKTAREHYDSERKREEREIIEVPEHEVQEVEEILLEFGMEPEHLPAVIEGFKRHPDKWCDFMMRFELGLEKPDRAQEIKSPLVIGSAYAMGGTIPLSPYCFTENIDLALTVSIVITMLALLVFGAWKASYSGVSRLKSAVQTCFIGGIAAAAAFYAAQLLA